MFQDIVPKTLPENVFSLIGDRWMLVTAGTAEHCNTMTASWGGLGVIWGAPAATCYIRPQRYTKEFLDREEFFTLSFFDEAYRRELSLCGSKSGREVDKGKACGFTAASAGCGAPYFEQASLVLVCRKRFVQPMDPANIPQEIQDKWYQDEAFMNEVEAAAGDGAMLFTLPYMKNFENGSLNNMWDYTLLRGPLHSKTLKFTYGAGYGTKNDLWYRETSELEPDAMVAELRTQGMTGIYLDLDGYPEDEQQSALAALTELELLGAARGYPGRRYGL